MRPRTQPPGHHHLERAPRPRRGRARPRCCASKAAPQRGEVGVVGRLVGGAGQLVDVEQGVASPPLLEPGVEGGAPPGPRERRPGSGRRQRASERLGVAPQLDELATRTAASGSTTSTAAALAPAGLARPAAPGRRPRRGTCAGPARPARTGPRPAAGGAEARRPPDPGGGGVHRRGGGRARGSGHGAVRGPVARSTRVGARVDRVPASGSNHTRARQASRDSSRYTDGPRGLLRRPRA